MPSEWWTYSLRDFLLFSPRTYYRLFELYNAAIWPAQLAALVLGLAILALLRRPGAARGRAVAAILAGCWLWVAIAFHAHRYATINPAAIFFAWGFGLEAALMIWTGIVRGRLVVRAARRSGKPRRASGSSSSRSRSSRWSARSSPRMAAGRDLRRGARPDGRRHARHPPARDRPGRGALFVVPAIWCAITGATLLAMKAPDAWIPPLAAALAVALAFRRRRARRIVGRAPTS